MPSPDPARKIGGAGSIPVIVNRAGGTAKSLGDALAERVTAAFAAAGLTAAVQAVAGNEVAAAVRAAADAPVVVVGGGDGTLGTAAQARIDSGGGTLGLLPLGTRNHLAGELGIPATLEGAAAVIAVGATRRIDLATVNDVGFVNNASIGFYPLLVRRRDAERSRRGLPKWLATIPAAWATLRRLPHHRLRIELADGARPVVTPLLFVGNNRYLLERGSIGQRVALDDGMLSVFAVGVHSRTGMVWFALRTLTGFGDPDRDFAEVCEGDALIVHSRSDQIHVALDGEVHRLVPPLRFAIRPLALTVLAPPKAAAA